MTERAAPDGSEVRGADTHELLASVERLRVELLAAINQAARPTLVDAAVVASELGVSRRWVYENADELGAVRLGDGVRGRLRFNLDDALGRFACSPSRQSMPLNRSNSNAVAASQSQPARVVPIRMPKPGDNLVSKPREGRAHAA